MSVPQHDRWVELFEEVERDPLPLWTRFGAATLPDSLFPRDYHTNPILVYFSRRKRWKEMLDPWLLFLVGYPLVYPLVLMIPASMGLVPTLAAILVLSTITLPILAAMHARQFIGRRMSNVPFQELALTRLTAAEIAQAFAVPPLADARASVLLGIGSFVVCVSFMAASLLPADRTAILVWAVLMGAIFLMLQTRMTLFAGIVAVHVALTGRNWRDVLHQLTPQVAVLVGGFLLVVVTSFMCFCVGVVVVLLYAIVLRERTSDLAHELWSEPEEWAVYKDE